MRKHVVYPCFLTPCLSIPVICLSPCSQELSAFWGSDFSCGGDSARWVLLRSDHAALSLCSVPGAQSIGHGWLHTQPGLSRFRPGHAGRCWPGAGRSKRRTHASWRTLLTVPSHHCPLLWFFHECRPAASLYPENVLLLPTPQCGLLWDGGINPEPFLCYKAHTSPAQSPRATARSPPK